MMSCGCNKLLFVSEIFLMYGSVRDYQKTKKEQKDLFISNQYQYKERLTPGLIAV